MTLEEAIEILELHNIWRRDNNIPPIFQMADPTKLGIAIDLVVKEFKSI